LLSRCQAHNLKVIGSNPIPATTFVITRLPSRSDSRDGFPLCEEDRDAAAAAAARIPRQRLGSRHAESCRRRAGAVLRQDPVPITIIAGDVDTSVSTNVHSRPLAEHKTDRAARRRSHGAARGARSRCCGDRGNDREDGAEHGNCQLSAYSQNIAAFPPCVRQGLRRDLERAKRGRAV
jgi:hypothetical protein